MSNAHIDGEFGGPFVVDPSMYKAHRTKLVSMFKDDQSVPGNSLLFFAGGKESLRGESDHENLFRQESTFHYLFSVKDPDHFGAINAKTGESTLYIHRLPPSYGVWMGEILSPAAVKDRYQVDRCKYVDEIGQDLQSMNLARIYLLRGLNTDSGHYTELPCIPGAIDGSIPGYNTFDRDGPPAAASSTSTTTATPTSDAKAPVPLSSSPGYTVDCTDVLYNRVVECRVFKTADEIAVLRYVNRICSQAHLEVMRECRDGMKEYQLEAIFRHYCLYHGGCRHAAYTPICGSGRNAAVLHYGHAGAPNGRTIGWSKAKPKPKPKPKEEVKQVAAAAAGAVGVAVEETETVEAPEGGRAEMVLCDLGCEYHCYVSDITCTYPSNGKFTKKQADLFNAVRQIQLGVFEAIKPGVDWPKMHDLAYQILCKELYKIGILIDPEEDNETETEKEAEAEAPAVVVDKSSTGSSSSSSSSRVLSDSVLQQMMALNIGSLFMPHGLGHLMGLDTHDVGGYPKHLKIERDQRPGYRSVRCGRSLEANMVITVEPGIYFIEACLGGVLSNDDDNEDNDEGDKSDQGDKTGKNSKSGVNSSESAAEGDKGNKEAKKAVKAGKELARKQRQFINTALLRSYWSEFGGCRLEDNIVIRNDKILPSHYQTTTTTSSSSSSSSSSSGNSNQSEERRTKVQRAGGMHSGVVATGSSSSSCTSGGSGNAFAGYYFENLTTAPRTVEEVEAVMGSNRAPLAQASKHDGSGANSVIKTIDDLINYRRAKLASSAAEVV